MNSKRMIILSIAGALAGLLLAQPGRRRVELGWRNAVQPVSDGL
jgi:hypothetical protein